MRVLPAQPGDGKEAEILLHLVIPNPAPNPTSHIKKNNILVERGVFKAQKPEITIVLDCINEFVIKFNLPPFIV